MKARIRGVQVHMQQFELFFDLMLGRNLLQHTHSLSVYLQRKSLSAAECQAMAALTIRTLKNMRADDNFALFWKDVTGRKLFRECYSAARAAAFTSTI